jgi:hypothetical protein
MRRVTETQAKRRLRLALDNIERYGIIDLKLNKAPEARVRNSPNFITVIPNTPENLEIMRNEYKHKVIFFGRGSRKKLPMVKTYYGSPVPPNYPLSLNPPYVAVYFRNKYK